MKNEYPFIVPDIGNPKDLGIKLGEEIEKLVEQKPLSSVMPMLGTPSLDLANLIVDYIKGASVKTPEDPIYAIPVSSATNGLAAILMSKNVRGKEILTTSVNYPGVINAIVLAGAIPKFVDIDENTFCMDLSKLKKSITKKTKAIVLVHLNNLIDVDEVSKIVGDDIDIIEDAALSFASTNNGMLSGTNKKTTACLFSFLGSKILCGFGGGVITSRDASLLTNAQEISYQGFDLASPNLISNFGANYKPNELSAVVALNQMERLADIVKWRKKLANNYDESIKLLDEFGVKSQKRNVGSVVTHYAVKLPNRDQLTHDLAKKYNIYFATWPVMHVQHEFKKRFGENKLPVSESIADSFVFLPFFKGMDQEDTDFICSKIAEVIKNVR